MDNNRSYWAIVIGASLLLLPFLGAVHLFDWDEINFAESAREMLVTANFRQVLVNYEPFWEKPPLFFWLQALSMKIFGVNEFAARFPNVLVAIATFVCLFKIGQKAYGERFSWWWILLYLASFTPSLYFHSGIIDPLLNLFVFLSVYQLFQSTHTQSYKPWLLSGTFLGLAILSKGPVAIVIVGLIFGAVWIQKKFTFWFNFKHLIVWVLVFASIASIWFLPEVIMNGPGFILNFFSYQIDLFKNPVASHGQPWFYHFVILAVGCVPASVIFIPSLVRAIRPQEDELIRWMKALFWVVLLLFSIVTTKIVHYSSMCYLPLTFLGALTLSEIKFSRFLSLGLMVMGFVWTLFLIVIPLIGIFNEEILQKFGHLIKDDYARSALAMDAGWTYFHFLPAIIFAFAIFLLWTGWKQNVHRQMRFGLVVMAVNISITLILFAPQIEKHSQHSVIDFYKTLTEDDCYVEVMGYKSYASYFYTKVNPLDSTDGLFKERERLLLDANVKNRLELNEEGRILFRRKEMLYFLHGEIDKPVYIVVQEKKIPFISEIEGFKMVMHQGGFAAFRRLPQ